MDCAKTHRYDAMFRDLPDDQGGAGRHKCAGCAYEAGWEEGRQRQEQLNIQLSTLPDSQAGTVRHKSPHAAFALGYQHGVQTSYEE